MRYVTTKLTSLGHQADHLHSSLGTSVTGHVSNLSPPPGYLLKAEIAVSF